MFSNVSVHLTVRGGGGPHVTADALDLPVQPVPLFRHQAWDQNPLLVTFGGHYRRPVQTYSFEDLPCPGTTPSGGY